MSNPEMGNHIDLIDNEQLAFDLLDKKVQQSFQEKEALILLNKLEGEVNIPDIDLDLAVDRRGEESLYYFISNSEHILKIPLKISQIKQMGEILRKAFLSEDNIYMNGSFRGRGIYIDDRFGRDTGFNSNDTLVTRYYFDKSQGNPYDGENLSRIIDENDKIEEIFTFIMKTRGLPMEEWRINHKVCNSKENETTCKRNLGTEESEAIGEIRKMLQEM